MLERCIVHDVAALIARLPLVIRARHYTTPLVAEEVRDAESRQGLEFMVETGVLEIAEPGGPPPSLPKRLADKLSGPDKSLLALAYKLRGECSEVALATDDYALQEAAARLGIKVVRVRYPGSRALRGGVHG